MLALFETDALFAAPTSRGLLDHTANCAFQDASGGVVAEAHDRAGAARRLGRAFARASEASRFEWDLLDVAGRRVLGIVKPKARLGGVRPEVSLADGTLLGRCVPQERVKAFPRVSFEGANGTSLGELVPALGERRASPVLIYRIAAGSQTEIGEVAQQLDTGVLGAPPAGPWGFHITFGPGADLAVRAMVIAYTLCLVQQRTT